MLYLCAVTVGVMSFYMADRKYRTAFLEARQSLQVKLTLEEQSTQQVSGGLYSSNLILNTFLQLKTDYFITINTCFYFIFM